jgi:DeoD family purine-nucleoside phosphorylase
MPRDPIHLQPTAPLAERVLLPGDPGRALLLAQALLEGPKMFNHHRGLWGYTGPAADGELLTIQATGMGGPSAAIVLEELADLGVTRAVRVGTCGALNGSLSLGDLIAVDEVLAADGTSRALGAADRVAPDASLARALAPHADASGLVVSSDLFYDPDAEREDAWRAEGALAVEMEAAALFAVGARRGIAVGCVLAVSDLVASRTRIDEDSLRVAVERLGVAGAEALGAVAPTARDGAPTAQ